MEIVWISSPRSRRISGLLALVAGVFILLFSSVVAGLIGLFISAIMLIISVIILLFGISVRGSGFSLPLILLGTIGSVFALSLLVFTDLAVSFLGILLGMWMILLGIGQLVMASTFSGDRLYHILILMGGILTMAVGLYLIISPVNGMQIMVAFCGAYLVVYGFLSLVRPDRTFRNYQGGQYYSEDITTRLR